MSEERIRVRPLNQWARNRVRQHGDTFIVLKRAGDKILVESIGETFRLVKGMPMEKWKGWFFIGDDAWIEADTTDSPYR